MGKKKKQTFIEGIEGLGASPLNDEYQAENNHGSFYDGLEVNADVKNELENQPAGEFINFVPNKDGSFHATAKIPEFGMDEKGNEYKLREYMNRCIKWSYDKLIMPDGTINEDLTSKVVYMGYGEDMDSVWQDIKNVVPEKELNSFQAFYQANSNIIQSNIMALYTEANKVLNYNRLVEMTPSNSIDPEQKNVNEFLANTYPDYLNTLKKFESIKNMNPATEKNIYSSFACDVYGGANVKFAEQVNKYRQEKGIEGSVDLESEKIKFPDKVNEPTKLSTFDFHVVDHIKANVGGQEFRLSLETTAPPLGQMFYQKSKSPQALGVYRSAEELHNTYKDIRNEVVEYKSAEEMNIAKAISSSKYKAAELERIPAKISFGYIKAEMRALENRKPKASFGQLLSAVDKIDKHVWSSKEFANMKEALNSLKQVKSLEDYNKKLTKLRENASKYIVYKDPNGDAGKAKKMSQLAKDRLALAKEILSFASYNERESAKALANTELAAKADHVIKNKMAKVSENTIEHSGKNAEISGSDQSVMLK